MEIMQLIVLAILVEALTEIVKKVYQDKKVHIPYLISIVIGLIIAIAVDFDVLTSVGLPNKIHYVGVISTGLLVSRGANFVSDIIQRIKAPKLEMVELVVDESPEGEEV